MPTWRWTSQAPLSARGAEEVRENYRKKKFEEEQKVASRVESPRFSEANQRRLVQKERESEIQAAADKKKQERFESYAPREQTG